MRQKNKWNLKPLWAWSVPTLALILIVLLVIIGIPRDEADMLPETSVPVRVLTVRPQTLHDRIVLPGRVAPNSRVRLSVEKGGRVVELPVDKGDRVGQGDVLLRIDDRHWRAQHRQATVELENAERDLKRWEQMRADGVVADSDYDAVRRRYDIAAAMEASAAVHLEQCTLVSPFDGKVDRREVELGEYVNEGQAVFQILVPKPLKIHVNVPERDVGKVAFGDICQISIPSLPGVVWTAKVNFVAQEALPGGFSFPVELIVQEPSDGLRSGKIVDVSMLREQKEGVMMVPLAAVIPRRGEHLVFVAVDEIAERRVVVLDRIVGQYAVLASGLQAGEQLVVEGHRALQDGEWISIEESEE